MLRITYVCRCIKQSKERGELEVLSVSVVDNSSLPLAWYDSWNLEKISGHVMMVRNDYLVISVTSSVQWRIEFIWKYRNYIKILVNTWDKHGLRWWAKLGKLLMGFPFHCPNWNTRPSLTTWAKNRFKESKYQARHYKNLPPMWECQEAKVCG